MDYKFKKGDVVRIKKNNEDTPECAYIKDSMTMYEGEVCEIRDIGSLIYGEAYSLKTMTGDNMPYAWRVEWLEPAEFNFDINLDNASFDDFLNDGE